MELVAGKALDRLIPRKGMPLGEALRIAGHENYPYPSETVSITLDSIGEVYHETRRHIMFSRQEGLTAISNRFHKPAEKSADIQELRDLHRQMVEQVAAAYGWDDLALEHDFHETAQGIRYTISDVARREILKRLLALNFERSEEEVKLGMHEKGKGKGKGKKKATDSNEVDDSKQMKLL